MTPHDHREFVPGSFVSAYPEGLYLGPVTNRAIQEGEWYLADPDNQGSPLTSWRIALNSLQHDQHEARCSGDDDAGARS